MLPSSRGNLSEPSAPVLVWYACQDPPLSLDQCAAVMQNGCLVVNAPTANTVAAAEHGIALICALSRNVAQADASMKAGRWDRNKYVGVSIVGKTLAVMGFGKVCTLAKAACPCILCSLAWIAAAYAAATAVAYNSCMRC